MRWLALLPLVACVDHLEIGALDPDAAVVLPEDAQVAPRLDASLLRDAAPVVDSAPDAYFGGPALFSWLRVFDRDDVTSIAAECGAPCLTAEVRALGGVPPYRVLWADGVEGATRSFCPGNLVGLDSLGSVARVEDNSSPPQAAVAAGSIAAPSGSCGDSGTSSWSVCLSSPREVPLGCAEGDWYPLDPALHDENISISVAFTLALFESSNVELHVASEPCGPLRFVSSSTVFSLQAALGGVTSGVSEAVRYIVLKAPSEPGARLPSSVIPSSLNTCFSR